MNKIMKKRSTRNPESTSNPNDLSAKYYDYYTQPLKGAAVTTEEIELIRSLVPKLASKTKVKILDVGCGTGRHLISLNRLKYQVTGIDNSPGMLHALQAKSKNISLIQGDIFKTALPEKEYDLIQLFWNTFNEIALTKTNAGKLLQTLKKNLKPAGKILINIDNPRLLDLCKLHFTTKYTHKHYTYRQNWQVIKFNQATRTTQSREVITVLDKKGRVEDQTTAYITQRWWNKKELRTIFNKIKLKADFLELATSQEFYIVLSSRA